MTAIAEELGHWFLECYFSEAKQQLDEVCFFLLKQGFEARMLADTLAYVEQLRVIVRFRSLPRPRYPSPCPRAGLFRSQTAQSTVPSRPQQFYHSQKRGADGYVGRCVSGSQPSNGDVCINVSDIASRLTPPQI